jgi:hypothetical protein
MYQMTHAALAEARRYCIRRHTVVEEGCSLNGLNTRVVPSHRHRAYSGVFGPQRHRHPLTSAKLGGQRASGRNSSLP